MDSYKGIYSSSDYLMFSNWAPDPIYFTDTYLKGLLHINAVKRFGGMH